MGLSFYEKCKKECDVCKIAASVIQGELYFPSHASEADLRPSDRARKGSKSLYGTCFALCDWTRILGLLVVIRNIGFHVIAAIRKQGIN